MHNPFSLRVINGIIRLWAIKSPTNNNSARDILRVKKLEVFDFSFGLFALVWHEVY
jgi:hypothetical protein